VDTNTETLISKIGEKYLENIKAYFHWIFVIAPSASIVLAKAFGQDEQLIDVVLIGASIATNFFLLWLWSYYEYVKTQELRLFRTFILNILPPIKLGEELLTNTEVAIVDVSPSKEFHAKVHKKFKTDPAVDDSDRIFVDDNNLTFKNVHCEVFDKEGLDDETIKRKERESKRRLLNDLSLSQAVVVVDNPQLKANSWVSDAVQSWADDKSDFPCLFVRKKGEHYAEDKVADNFLWIYDDPNLLPWKLLQRAKDRSSAWRSQASFNRAMVTSIAYILIMVTIIGFMVRRNLAREIENKQEKTAPVFTAQRAKMYGSLAGLRTSLSENRSNGQTVNEVSPLRDESPGLNEFADNVRALVTNIRDEYKVSYTSLRQTDPLEVSFWFPFGNQAQLFVTTETNPERNQFEVNDKSIIGCGFNHRNHLVRWPAEKNPILRWLNIGQQTEVLDFSGQDSNIRCQPWDRQAKPIFSISCISYNHYEEFDQNGQHTVGICVFSGDPNANIFMSGNDKYLQERARELDSYIEPLLSDNLVKKLFVKSNSFEPLKATQ